MTDTISESDIDICECGDYRRQHDERGCKFRNAGRQANCACSAYRHSRDATYADIQRWRDMGYTITERRGNGA